MKLLPLFTILCGVALAQQDDYTLNARNVIGMENIKHNTTGKLTIQDGAMHFSGGKTEAKIPAATIEDIVTGSETTQSGGTAGRLVKTAAPYDSGAGLSLLLRTKVDILTVEYRDANGGRHAAILALPKGRAEAFRTQLVTAGAHTKAPVEPALRERKDVAPPAAARPRSSPTAIQIDEVDSGDVPIPAEFRLAIYERLIQRVTESGKFQKVLRSGDHAAADIPHLVTLHTTVQGYKQGSQMKREITTVLGATRVDVSTTVTGGDGQTLLQHDIIGRVRFFGENLGVTNDLAKRIAKLLHRSL
jgi:hypothetical protein